MLEVLVFAHSFDVINYRRAQGDSKGAPESLYSEDQMGDHLVLAAYFDPKSIQRVLTLCYFWDLEKVALAKNCISKIFILCMQ